MPTKSLAKQMAADATLAGACFAGVGFEALVVTAIVGTVLAVRSRRKRLPVPVTPTVT